MTRVVRRVVGDLLTIGGVVVVGTFLAIGIIFLIVAIVMAIVAPGWELGPGD